ncbi:DUF3185 family protein [Kineobactrum salinum]|uniref:DUF3185 family protein n=1 Tax=Kineobactrum salinum TaxID=2708301 RepID=A0A6C0U0D0_9GAMM|nr:DUF3185 family protein [Kineobactrum salinum]QIB65039.1 DUF3185 family protein [Kineobactrum salinum]
MSKNQIIGIVLLVVGVILLYFGYEASQSVGEQVVEGVSGSFTDSTVWYLVLGAAATIGGLAMLVFKR